MKKNTNFYSYLILICLGLFAFSCGGGGSSSSSPIAVSESNYLLTGAVIDNDTQQPLGSAQVTVEGSTVTSNTDENGNFSLELKTKSSSVLVNTTAPGFSSNQKVINIGDVSSSETPFTSISLKAATVEDTVLLSSIASSGKKNSKKTKNKTNKKFESEGIEVPLSKVTLNPVTESDLIPGNAATSEDDTTIDFLAVIEVGLINPNTNQPLTSVPSDFTYNLAFKFPFTDENLDLGSLPLWKYEKSKGKWIQDKNANPISTDISNGYATVVFQITNIGWYAIGKKVSGLACLKGRVLDQNGNSISNAIVKVIGVSFNGQNYGATDSNGIFEIKTKPGSTIKVLAEYSGVSTNAETLTLQNYLHNQGGVPSGTYCQPAGPTSILDTFYTKYSNFKNLVPPTGYLSILTSEDQPLTLTLKSHKIVGTILYATSSGNKPVPKTDSNNKPNYVQIDSFGSFVLTEEGISKFSLSISEKTDLTAFATYKLGNSLYSGKVSFSADPANSESTFELILENTTTTTIQGKVTLDGIAVQNATVNLSSGQNQSTDSNGNYKFEIPTSFIPDNTSIYATYKKLSTNEIFFSASQNLTSDLNQTIDIPLLTFTATVTGFVFDHLGSPISDAKISVLVDDQSIGLQTITSSLGNYKFNVPLKSTGVTTLKIIANYEIASLNKTISGFTSLQISAGNDATVTPTFEATKIVLDLSSKETKVKGKISVNGILQPKILVVFENTKVYTGISGEFETNINPGENILSLYAGEEPLLIDSENSNIYPFTATQGTTTDLGTLECSLEKSFVYFNVNQFQKNKSLLADIPIKAAVAENGGFVYLLLKAIGSNEIPIISFSDETISKVSEATDSDENSIVVLYEIPISSVGTFSYKFSASTTDGSSATESNTISIVKENQAPIITASKQESDTIESTDSNGIIFAIAASDPEGDDLTYKWEILNPTDKSCTLINSETDYTTLITDNTTATQILLMVTVSDGIQSTSKRFSINVSSSSLSLLSFTITPESVAGLKDIVTVNFETNDKLPPTSITLDWGDGSSENLKKSKLYSTEHIYESEGYYTISLILISNESKNIFSKTIFISESYKAPILTQGLLDVLEDESGKLDLSSLISNLDKTINYTFSLVKFPSAGRAYIEGSVLYYTPNTNFNGNDLLLIKAFDGVSFSNDTDVKIAIKSVNDAPILYSTDLQATPNVTLSLNLLKLVYDPDTNDIQSFKVISDPSLGKISISDSTLYYVSETSGTDKFELICNDGTASSNIAIININVSELSKELVLAGGKLATDQNKELIVDLLPYLTNPSNLKPITFKVTQQGSLGEAIISGNQLFYTPLKDATGDDRLTIVALADTGLSTEPALFSINIASVVTPPVLKDNSYSVMSGNSLIIELTKLLEVYDPNSTVKFFVGTKVVPTKGDYSLNGSELTYIPIKGESGSDSISVYAIVNDLESNVALLTITIEKEISLPVITSSPLTSTNEGDIYTYKIDAIHPNNLPLTYVLNKGPSWLKLVGNVLSGKPSQIDVGSSTIDISVQDGTNTVSQNYILTVIDVNFAPTFTSTVPTTAIADILYTYVLKATDSDGDALTFLLTEGPKNMTFDEKTSTISWIPLATDPIENLVVVEVTDGKLSASQKFYINVTISAPVIKSFVADDPDDRDLEFSNDDTITITFDQATNMPSVRSKTDVDTLLKFNDSIGDDYFGEWIEKNQLVIYIVNAGKSSPGIGSLRVSVLKEGNLLNIDQTSVPSESTSDVITGDWGTK